MKERTMREVYPNELYHHGILGQKWGVRRYQNEDGSYTTAGRQRYLNARSLESQAEESRESGHYIKAKILSKKADKAMKKVDKKDQKWVNRQHFKLEGDAKEHLKALNKEYQKKTKKEMKRNSRRLGDLASGDYSKTIINEYNRKLANLMNTNITAYAPSGRIVQWVAKRGELGVMVGLADEGYDMSKLKNGVWSSGRIAYRKETVGKTH